MAFKRSVWVEFFPRDNPPRYPCPSCEDGRLMSQKDSLYLGEPQYSRAQHSHDEWHPDWIVERYSLIFLCDREDCGEIVTTHGDTALIEEYDDEFGGALVSVFQPISFFPPPPIIALPQNLPAPVIQQMRQVFALFWIDIGSAGNRLRTSLETVLDDLKVARKVMNNKKGKMVDLDLNGRIQLLEKKSSDQAQTFHALRMIGNLGSHTNELSREALLDALELYEEALMEIYSNRKDYLDALKKKIISTKGNY